MAERSIIDTMARALANNDLSFDRWSQLDDVAHEAYRRDARAALRSLLEAGPTEAMLGCSEVRLLGRSLDDEGILEFGSGIEAVYDVGRKRSAELFTSMLRAALEETGNV
ncbi:hypothetical protein E6C67_08300 [Azospirillum sp. TSA2s]|uniref:hypothetical protein n=1 Tax=Azospirillum sp. TSA2s TaxID=709810 RepID=UPI0010AA5326|nr:hypothetical protein [Azospirillum sp. TSA2s]QCG93940.1 hypothetical protein E6C67_08300 [Azospirillum sp. TSA2s]